MSEKLPVSLTRQAQNRVIEAIIISAPEMFGCRERARVDIAWAGISQPGGRLAKKGASRTKIFVQLASTSPHRHRNTSLRMSLKATEVPLCSRGFKST